MLTEPLTFVDDSKRHYVPLRGSLVLWVGRPSHVSFGFYLREAFQSQTNTEKLQQVSLQSFDITPPKSFLLIIIVCSRWNCGN